MYSGLFKETDAVYASRVVCRFFLTESCINFQINLPIKDFFFLFLYVIISFLSTRWNILKHF